MERQKVLTVLVLDKQGAPLTPCSERRARSLVGRGRAVVHCDEPLTIQMQDDLHDTRSTSSMKNYAISTFRKTDRGGSRTLLKPLVTFGIGATSDLMTAMIFYGIVLISFSNRLVPYLFGTN